MKFLCVALLALSVFRLFHSRPVTPLDDPTDVIPSNLIPGSGELERKMRVVLECYTKQITASPQETGRCLANMQELVTTLQDGPMVWMKAKASESTPTTPTADVIMETLIPIFMLFCVIRIFF